VEQVKIALPPLPVAEAIITTPVGAQPMTPASGPLVTPAAGPLVTPAGAPPMSLVGMA
jgi:hypothetical protein